MRSISTFIKRDFKFLLLALVNHLMLIFVAKNLIYTIFFCALGFSLTFIARKFYLEERMNAMKQRSLFSFLSYFFASVQSGKNVKMSYDKACNFLLGFHEVKTYDLLLEEKECYPLKSMQRYFNYALEMEEKNEALLHDYSVAEKIADERFKRIDQKIKNAERCDHTFAIAFFLLSFSVLLCFELFSNLKAMSENLIYLILGTGSINMTFPCYLYALRHELRRNKDEI